MDQLLSKFTNLGYEIFGIFVPGLILLLYLIFIWWCAGPLAQVASFGFLPQAEVRVLTDFFKLLNEEIRVGVFLGLMVSAYFLGHLLHWVARAPKSRGPTNSGIARVLACIRFSIPKSSVSYDDFLQPLFDEVKPFFGLGPEASWSQFYPVAKAFLSANLGTSLVATYQNKYTLHRSLTAAAAVWFWLAVSVLLASVVLVHFGSGEPKWVPLILSLPASLILIFGFSDSYAYNWKLFGNTIITETFMIKRSPRDVS